MTINLISFMCARHYICVLRNVRNLSLKFKGKSCLNSLASNLIFASFSFLLPFHNVVVFFCFLVVSSLTESSYALPSGMQGLTRRKGRNSCNNKNNCAVEVFHRMRQSLNPLIHCYFQTSTARCISVVLSSPSNSKEILEFQDRLSNM